MKCSHCAPGHVCTDHDVHEHHGERCEDCGRVYVPVVDDEVMVVSVGIDFGTSESVSEVKMARGRWRDVRGLELMEESLGDKPL